MAQNLCSPQNIYGPYEHTLFLGCSVMSFTSNTGWNQQGTEVTVNLVKDPCGGNKVYWDSNLNKQVWNGPDPGIYFYGDFGPPVNAPVYFRVADFEFCGLLQSWTEEFSTGGNPTYQVKIVDPRAILEGTQIITGDYAGSVYNTYNLFNAYGFMEAFYGTNCPNSPAGGFGGAQVNDNGMPAVLVIQAIKQMTSSLVPISNQFSPYGRLLYKGSQSSGFGVMNYNMYNPAIPAFWGSNGNTYHDGYLSSYFLDLSDLPPIPSYWRIPGPNINLMDFLNQICTDSGRDFYIELLPARLNGFIQKFIKIRTISRVAQPIFGRINQFVNSGNGTVNSSRGVEGRTEPTTQFVIGGNKHGIHEIGTSSAIEPFFGFDENGEAIESYIDNGLITFEQSSLAINNQLSVNLGSPSFVINESELRTALTDYDNWIAWGSAGNSELLSLLSSAHGKPISGILNCDSFIDMVNNLPPSITTLPADIINTKYSVFKTPEEALEKDLQTCYDFIKNIAENYYGKKWMVRIPFTCVSQDVETSKIITSEVPADSGWSDNNSILGLPHPSAYTDFFADEDGKIKPFMYFDNTGSKLELSELDDKEDYGTVGSNCWIKVDIEPQLVWVDGTPRVVVTLPDFVGLRTRRLTGEDVGQVIDGFLATLEARAFQKGGEPLRVKVANIVKNKLTPGVLANKFWAGNSLAWPDGAAITMKSNVLTYGPWVTSGPPGTVVVEQDDGLTPWDYGSSQAMNLAGQSRSDDAVTAMQAGETGNVTVAGYPTLPLGAELGSYTALGGFQLVENRSVSTSGNVGYLDGISWSGMFGPNISNITVNVDTSGVNTQYTMRTFTPQFGRWTKQASERFKTLAKKDAQQRKAIRLMQLQQLRQRQKESNAKKQRRSEAKNAARRGQTSKAGHSPHMLFVGEMIDWGETGFKRTDVHSSSTADITNEYGKYENLAIMSLDGLLRPISIHGSAGLPRFVDVDLTNCNVAASGLSQPPIYIDSEAQYNLKIDNRYLNPFVNPSDEQHSSDETKIGHDIDILAHGSEPNEHGLSGAIDGVVKGEPEDITYADDYRAMALRGPLIISGWGYTTDGKPIPNEWDNDEDASEGRFRSEDVTDKFLEGFLRKPHTWPTGPVDLRFDLKRGVWTAPPPYRLLTAKLIDNLEPYGEVDAKIYIHGTSTTKLYDKEGNEISIGESDDVENNPVITVREVLGQGYLQDTNVLCYYDASECVYYILSGTGNSQLIIAELLEDLEPFSSAEAVVVDGTDPQLFSPFCEPIDKEDPFYEPKFLITEVLGDFVNKNTRVICYYNAALCTYHILEYKEIYKLVICNDDGDDIYTNTDLSAFVRRNDIDANSPVFIKFEDKCYTVRKLSDNEHPDDLSLREVNVQGIYTDCEECSGTCYMLYPWIYPANDPEVGCDPGGIINAIRFKSNNPTLQGRVGKFVKYNGKCWELLKVDCNGNENELANVTGEYDTCLECNNAKCYQIQSCDSNTIYTVTNDLSEIPSGNKIYVKAGNPITKGCYSVVGYIPGCGGAINITYSATEYPDCETCANCYDLLLCGESPFTEENWIRNVRNDLSGCSIVKIPENASTVISGQKGRCYEVHEGVDCESNFSNLLGDYQCLSGDCNQTECVPQNCAYVTECGNDSPIGPYLIVDEDNNPINIGNGGIAIDPEDCTRYRLDPASTCTPSDEKFTIKNNSYQPGKTCGNTQITHLAICSGNPDEFGPGDPPEPICTHTDLSAYPITSIFRINGHCWQIIGTCTDCEDTVDVTVEDTFNSCEEMSQCCSDCYNQKYYEICPCSSESEQTDDCDCEDDEPEDPESSDCICTTENLSQYIGRYVKFNGKCYTVSRTEECDSPQIISVGSDYDDCKTCKTTAERQQLTFVSDVYWQNGCIVIERKQTCVVSTNVCDLDGGKICAEECEK